MKRHQNSALSIWLMCRSNKTQGLALIEVLVILLMIAVLAAVSVPSLLSQTGKAKQVEARNSIGAMNRAQQAYFKEKKGAFAGSLEQMGIGIKSETTNYRYFTQRTDRAAFNYAIAKEPKLKSYVGAVWTVTGTDGKTTTQAILCEAKKPAVTKPADPVYVNGKLLCGEGTKMLGQ